MNFYKNIFKCYPKYCYLNSRCQFPKKLHSLAFRRTFVSTNHQKFTKRKSGSKTNLYSTLTTYDVDDLEEITDVYPYLNNQNISNSDIARGILFKNNNDPKISEIGKCASVDDVFSFVRKNSSDLNYKYLTQVVFVLSDLQNMFYYHFNDESEVREDFYKNLLKHQEFYSVINSIEKNLENFDIMFLSYIIVYLNKLGLPVLSSLIQNMAIKIRNHLVNDFSYDVSARLFKVIFGENSVRPYYTVIDIIPKVFDKIASIQTIKELEDLTVCLTMLNELLTDDIVKKYTEKINEMIENKTLTGADYQVLIKALSLLNYPNLRSKNSLLIAKYILLMKDSIELLNFKELGELYQVFFKSQEPGDVLNTIQRASAKLLHEHEDLQLQRETMLKLFSCLIYFSSPAHRMQFRRDIKKHLHKKETLNSLLVLRKIFSYLKISDVDMCNILWGKAYQSLKEEKDIGKIISLFENYLFFFTDNSAYRHLAFEHTVFQIIQRHLREGTLTIFPTRFFSAFCFALVFCRDSRLMDCLVEYFKQLKSQMTSADLLKISQVISLIRQQRSIITSEQLKDIKNICNEVTMKIYTQSDDMSLNTLLIKAAVLRSSYENQLVDEILLSCKQTTCMSSKMLENLCFSLFATSALVPEIINKCSEYVIHHKSSVIGFNAEKLLFLCYYLNYYPVHAERFFNTVTDLMIRDQERLSGLSFLQAALSLCYFNRLPKSFIKQIFNVEFLDKLDVELANCYFRDVYPQRVRRVLMQLNRAVCLEYPEFNVPWFHQKYIEEFQKTNAIDDLTDMFQLRVKDYLVGVLDENTILENVRVPYGYMINFVVHLDKDNKPTSNFDDVNTLKLALLLKYDSAFTRFFIRLKGNHELKHRHLEILGYKVKIVKRNDWENLLYANERIEFIKSLVFS